MSMAPRPFWTTLESRRGPNYGTVSPFTKPPKRGRWPNSAQDGEQSAPPPMPRSAQNPHIGETPAGGKGMECAGQSRPGHNQLAVHPQEGPSEVRIQIL